MVLSAKALNVFEPRYMSLDQAAVYLALSPKTLYKWASLGQICAHKLGRVWRFDKEELDRFVHASGTNSNAVCYNSLSSRSAVDFSRKG